MKKLLFILVLTLVASVTNAQTDLCFSTKTDGQKVSFQSSHSTVTWIFGSNAPVSTTNDTISFRFADSDTNSLQTVSMIANGDTLTKDVIVLVDADTTSDTTTTSIDGVDEFEIDVTIYPNPITHSLNINLNDSYYNGIDIVMSDISGKVVIRQTIYQNTTLDVSNFNSGLYLLTMNYDGNITTKKVLKR